tara:strand:+ start:2773 stop:4503 length:1731 start_codon:yes stop_codon:yes gene_type:complete
MVSRWYHLCIIVVFVFTSATAYAEVTKITSTVDKNPVIAKESFVLTVTFNDDVPNSAFQPDILLSDFVVGRTSVSRQTSLVNGDLKKLTQFTTVLVAKTPGDYQIPSFSLDGANSDPITMTVVAPDSDAAKRSDKMAFVDASLDTSSVFLQQPIHYIVRLYLAADLNKGNLIPPEMENADIRQIGKDEEYSEMNNGRRYRVYQRTYQITPNQSGEFEIEGARFDGEVYASGQRSIFSSFSNTQPVSAIAETKSVQVKPIPQNWTGHWLPSELVTISQTVTPEKQTYDVGEPISISLMLTAVGVKPEQLPDIDYDYPDSVRVYPDNENTDQFVRNGVNIAQKTIKYAIVPQQPGNITLPGIDVPWFNTKTQQRAVATTDELSFDVEGIAMSQSQQKAIPEQPEQPRPQTQEAKPEPTQQKSTEQEPNNWLWVVLALAVALLISLGINLWLYKRRVAHVSNTSTDATHPVTKSEAWRAFQQACAKNQPQQATQSLKRWANQKYQQRVNTLSDVAKLLNATNDSAIRSELNQLQTALYAAKKRARWQRGKQLYQAIRNAQQQSSTRTASSPLPPMYPIN